MTAATPADLRQRLEEVVPADRIADASTADEIDGVTPSYVVEPRSVDEAAALLRFASQAGVQVVPRGGGTRMSWGNPPAGADVVVSTRRLDAVLEHATGDMTATVQAGVTLDGLQEVLASAGQTLALDVPFAEQATLGGLIATNDSGSLRLRYGGIRDLLIGITVIRADGTVARGGGRVVKNVAGYDLPKLFTGSLGTLGLIVEATFRLHPLPARSRTLAARSLPPDEAGRLVMAILDSPLTPLSVSVTSVEADRCDLYARFGGIEPSVESQTQRLRTSMASAGSGWDDLGADEADRAWDNLAHLPWTGDRPAVVCHLSVLPSDIPSLLHAIEGTTRRLDLRSRAVVHAHGLATCRLASPNGSLDPLIDAVRHLRQGLARHGGTTVILDAPPEVKAAGDVWGPSPDSIQVMRQIKKRFDPGAILNPGRFLQEVS